MVELKGLCEWKLVDKDSGAIVKQGAQENLCTDYILNRFIGYYGGVNFYWQLAFNVQLSDTVPTPGVDYRRAGASTVFNVLEQNTDGAANNDYTLRSKWNFYNFAPPVAPRTITVIGIGYNTNPLRFISFIELSTPITQQTNQYLYVKYTNFFNYTVGGYNTPDNHYIEYGINSMLLKGGESAFSAFYSTRGFRSMPLITPFLPPTDIDKLMRHPGCYISIMDPFTYATNKDTGGSEWVAEILRNYIVTEIVGPIGSMAWAGEYAWNVVSGGGWMRQTYGCSPIPDLLPSISRVFVHPESRIAQIFSDPSYPATSQGNIVLSGTPTNKYPIIGRIKITKTGDASDIVDETFTADSGTNELTVAQTWAKDDIVRLTTTGTLPGNLSAGTDYFLLSGGTAFQVSLSKDGTAIDILDAGTGTHTIIRQNTGKYILEEQPWGWPNVYGMDPVGGLKVGQLPMGVDVDGKAMPQYLESIYDTGEGGVSYSAEPTYMLRGHAQIGDYIYTIQKSRVGGVHNVCRWPLMSLETSESLCKFGTSALVINSVVVDGTDMYIATATGIYKYDSNNETVAPSLLTITGLIDLDVRDLALDSATGILWAGHSTGLSKIDTGALTATQFIAASSGDALYGLAADDVNIQRGQLSVYNGRVLRIGHCTALTNRVNEYRKGWVMDDGSVSTAGWMDFSTAYPGGYPYTLGGHLREATNDMLVYVNDKAFELTVTITGKGTGTMTTIRSYTTPHWQTDTLFSPIVQLDADTFYFVWHNYYAQTHKWGSGADIQNYMSTLTFVSSLYNLPYMRNLIDVGEGVKFLMYGMTVYVPIEGYPYKFGFTGGNWVKDDATEKNIQKTGTPQALLFGVSLVFNNAVGKNWDEQFIATERFTFVHAPYKVKDNLQTMQFKTRYYSCEAAEHSSVAVAVPGSAPYTHHITEQSNPDFRDLDPVDYAVEVFEGATEYTAFAIAAGVSATPDYSLNSFTVALNIPTGTPVRVTSLYGIYTVVFPLRNFGIYYAINVDATHVKLAYTYAEALAGTAIDLVSLPAQDNNTYLQKVEPTAGTYLAGSTGVFVFAAADTGKNLTLKYVYTLYS